MGRIYCGSDAMNICWVPERWPMPYQGRSIGVRLQDLAVVLFVSCRCLRGRLVSVNRVYVVETSNMMYWCGSFQSLQRSCGVICDVVSELSVVMLPRCRSWIASRCNSIVQSSASLCVLLMQSVCCGWLKVWDSKNNVATAFAFCTKQNRVIICVGVGVARFSP